MQKHIHIESHHGTKIRGEFKAILYNPDGSIAVETDWNSNQIVANGMIIYGTSSWYQFCTIGSNGTGPGTGDTGIGSLLGTGVSSSTNPLSFSDYPRPPVAPNYERYSVKKWRFNAGNGTGTVAEFTISAGNNGTNIFCRHTLPVPIVKSAQQVLDVFYRFYTYPDLVVKTGQVVIDGITYNWETSYYNVQYYNNSTFALGGLDVSAPYLFVVYDGAKAALLDTAPSGNSANGAVQVNVQNGSGYIDSRFDIGLDQCNTSTGKIKVVAFNDRQKRRLQCTFSAVDGPDIGGGIPKTEIKIMSLTFKYSWARYVP